VPAISYGITDRLQLGVLAPGVAYRFGDPGDIEWIPSIQSDFSGGYGRNLGALFAFTPSVVLDVRRWLGPRTHLTIGALARSAFSHRGGSSNCPKSASELCVETTRAFETWRVGGQLAFTHTFGRTATVSLGGYASYAFNRLDATDSDTSFGIGSAVRTGVWSAPPLRFHLARWMSIDVFGGYARSLARGENWVWVGEGARFLW